MSDSFTKLFSSIIHSTIWRERNHVRLVWITMLAMVNRDGIVEASVPGLADAARVTVAECKDALRKLASPDKHSRSKEHDGRRIQEVDGGWHLLNYGKYRLRMSAIEQAEKNAARQRNWRNNLSEEERRTLDASKRQAKRGSDQGPDALTRSNGALTESNDSNDIAEGEAEADQKRDPPCIPPGGDQPEQKSEPKRIRKRGWHRFPPDYEPTEEHRSLATELGVSIVEQITLIRDHEFKNTHWDPAATLRTWLRNAATRFGPVAVRGRADRRKQEEGGNWTPNVEKRS